MKQLLFTTLLTATFLLVTTKTEAAIYTGSCGENLTWSYDSDSGALTISGSGPMTDYTGENESTWDIHKNGITSISLPDGITTIGAYAFGNCTLLTDIEIPSSVTAINENAFIGCTSLSNAIFYSNPTIATGSVPENTSCELIINDAETTEFSRNSNKYDIIRYQRTLESGESGTIVLPFEISDESKSAYRFYEIRTSTDNTLAFSQISDPQPNIPYLYENAQATTATEITSIPNATILDDEVKYMLTDNELWTMVGIYTTLDVTLDAYLEITYALVDGEIKNSSSNVIISPFRCYFLGPLFSELFPSNTSSYRIILNGYNAGTTSINNIATTENNNSFIYDLRGRRTETASKGIYIINGKKTFIE